ncbi:MAG: hypothetical protein O0X93_05810 [Methanocorpusculum sp.]|nr:hypothetical protein [Methanocorpusculum sp.]MDE2524352.1 hypothetical protein [Methanocorpusculum sp.]
MKIAPGGSEKKRTDDPTGAETIQTAGAGPAGRTKAAGTIPRIPC